MVNKVEVGVFEEFSCFFYDPMNVGNLMSGFTDFFSVQLVNVDFLDHILLKLAWGILSITLLACEMTKTVR